MNNIENIVKELDKNLCPSRVKKNEYSGHDHIESWDAIRLANDVFGYMGWTSTIDKMEKVSAAKSETGTYEIAYMATVTVSVDYIDENGLERTSKRQGSGVGLGFKKKLGDAYEMAIKNAETDAEKRAFRKFGHPFGLALYDKERKYVSRQSAPITSTLTEAVKLKGSEFNVRNDQATVSVSEPMEGLIEELSAWKNSIFCLDDLKVCKFTDREGVPNLIEQLSDDGKVKLTEVWKETVQNIQNSFKDVKEESDIAPI